MEIRSTCFILGIYIYSLILQFITERVFIVFNQSLIAAIEQKREELIQIVSEKGFSSSLTVKHSQELDALLNQYYYIYQQPYDKPLKKNT